MNRIAHNKLTQKDFMSRVEHLSADLDFSKSKYISNNTKVTIGCKLHGEVMQYPHILFKGGGCGQCGNASGGIKRMLAAQAKYFEECKVIHNDFYDYSKSEYTGAHNKIAIECPLHGEFVSSANNHRKGSGCATCGRMRTEASADYGGKGVICKSTLSRGNHSDIKLYVLRITSRDEEFYKVGLSKCPTKRTYGIRSDSNKAYAIEILDVFNGNPVQLFELEQFIISNSNLYKPSVKFGGYTECISDNPIPTLQAKISDLG